MDTMLAAVLHDFDDLRLEPLPPLALEARLNQRDMPTCIFSAEWTIITIDANKCR